METVRQKSRDDSPVMQQYRAAQDAASGRPALLPDGRLLRALLRGRRAASRLLGLTLTSRDKGEEPVPMAGVPARNAETYINRLIRLGEKVVICDQVQDPRDASGTHRPRGRPRHHAGHAHGGLGALRSATTTSSAAVRARRRTRRRRVRRPLDGGVLRDRRRARDPASTSCTASIPRSSCCRIRRATRGAPTRRSAAALDAADVDGRGVGVRPRRGEPAPLRALPGQDARGVRPRRARARHRRRGRDPPLPPADAARGSRSTCCRSARPEPARCSSSTA